MAKASAANADSRIAKSQVRLAATSGATGSIAYGGSESVGASPEGRMVVRTVAWLGLMRGSGVPASTGKEMPKGVTNPRRLGVRYGDEGP